MRDGDLQKLAKSKRHEMGQALFEVLTSMFTQQVLFQPINQIIACSLMIMYVQVKHGRCTPVQGVN